MIAERIGIFQQCDLRQCTVHETEIPLLSKETEYFPVALTPLNQD